MISEIIDGNPILFTAGIDCTIKLWNTETDILKHNNNYVATLFGHKGSVINSIKLGSCSCILYIKKYFNIKLNRWDNKSMESR